jgi:hypothetical protein
VTVRKPHRSLSLKGILASQTPFARLLKRLREIAEKCGSDIRAAGRNPVVFWEPPDGSRDGRARSWIDRRPYPWRRH